MRRGVWVAHYIEWRWTSPKVGKVLRETRGKVVAQKDKKMLTLEEGGRTRHEELWVDIFESSPKGVRVGRRKRSLSA
jgi:hypothetical protein